MSVKKRLSGLVRVAGKTPSTVKQTHGEAPTHSLDMPLVASYKTQPLQWGLPVDLENLLRLA